MRYADIFNSRGAAKILGGVVLEFFGLKYVRYSAEDPPRKENHRRTYFIFIIQIFFRVLIILKSNLVLLPRHWTTGSEMAPRPASAISTSLLVLSLLSLFLGKFCAVFIKSLTSTLKRALKRAIL